VINAIPILSPAMPDDTSFGVCWIFLRSSYALQGLPIASPRSALTLD
jgi:hypothetical protein